MKRFARSWMCAAALALSTLAAGPVAADPVTDARAAWQAQVATTGAGSAEALGAEWTLAQALTEAGRLEEAEPHWRTMLAAAETRFTDDTGLRIQIQLQLAMNLVRQSRYDEGSALAMAVLPEATALFGPTDERVGLANATLGTAYMLQGRYDLAEPPMRAAFENALARDGGGRAGPYALLLQQIYTALGRETEARAVIALTDPDQQDSGRQYALTGYREAGDWPRLAQAARTWAADWRMRNDALARDLAQEAEIDLARAQLELARAGQGADFEEADAVIARVVSERTIGRGGWSLARALNVRADMALSWPGHEDFAAGVRDKGLALDAMVADVGPDHPDALNQALIYGALLLQSDPQAAAPVLAGWYDAGLRGLVPPDDWSTGAALLAGVLALNGDASAGYRLAAGAAMTLRDWALAPERRDNQRGLLRRRVGIFRTQVDLAWGYAVALDSGTRTSE